MLKLTMDYKMTKHMLNSCTLKESRTWLLVCTRHCYFIPFNHEHPVAKLSERMMLARFTHIANKRHLIPPEQVEFRHGWCLEDSSVYGGRGLRKVDVTRWMASTGAQQITSSPRPRSPRQSPTLVIRTCRYYDTSEGSCVSAALRRSGGSVCH